MSSTSRCSTGASTGQTVTGRGPARMAWSNPDLAETGRISLPHWLQLRGYIVTLHRADQVSIVERVKCVPSVLR